MINLPPGVDPSTIVPGVDLSHWEPDTDFHALYDAGIRFVITKATDTLKGVDPKYAAFRAKADTIRAEHDDFFFGAFHFFGPGANPAAQYQHFRDVIGKPQPGDIIPALDSETEGYRVGQGSWEFDQACVDDLGYHTMLYTYEPFYLQFLKAHGFGNAIAAHHMRLWLARYRSRKPDTPCDIWQFSDAGAVPGEPKTMDVDIFWGSIDDFRERMLVK